MTCINISTYQRPEFNWGDATPSSSSFPVTNSELRTELRKTQKDMKDLKKKMKHMEETFAKTVKEMVEALTDE